LVGGAIAALAIATVAAAAQPAPPPGVAQGTAAAPMAPMPPPGAPHIRMMFGDDHVMTRDEVSKHVGKLFARLDTNHDGYITRDEVEAVHQKMEAAMAKVGDVEQRLARRGVFIGDRGAMFDRLDTNHDGNISRQEFMASQPVREERVMIMRPDSAGAPGAPLRPMDGHPGMMRMHHLGGMGMGMSGLGGHLFEMADANHDGRVSLAEAQAAALAHFDKADRNHDGRITPDERVEIRLERHEREVN
jgi:Ca2+-binding EF-hand superfamily protein